MASGFTLEHASTAASFTTDTTKTAGHSNNKIQRRIRSCSSKNPGMIRNHASSSTAVMENDDHDNDNDHKNMFHKATKTIEKCSRTSLLSAVIDFITLGGGAALLSEEQERNTFSQLGFVLLASLWKAAFGLALQRNIRLGQKAFATSSSDALFVRIEQMYQTMSYLWRFAALVLFGQASLSLMVMGGRGQHPLLFDHNHLAQGLGATVVVLTLTALYQIHGRQTKPIRAKQDLSDTAIKARQTTLVVFRTMAVFSLALIYDGLVKFGIAVRQDTWMLVGLQLSSVPTSIGVAGLVWKLRQSGIHAFSALLDAKKFDDVDSKTKMDLFQAQCAFYGKTEAVFRSDILGKLGLGTSGIVKSIFVKQTL